MAWININDTPLITYTTLTELWNGIGGLDYASESQLFDYGFRPIIMPDFNQSTHKIGSLYYDEINQVGMYELIQKTPEEIQAEITAAAQAAQDEALMYLKNSKILAEIQEFEDEDALQNQAAFPFWEAGIYVSVGEKRQHFNANNELKLYKCIQAHPTLENWPPKDTPAMWVEIAPPGVIPVWVQPLGSHDAYQIDDLVHFPTESDPVYRNTFANNTYAPNVYGWVLND